MHTPALVLIAAATLIAAAVPVAGLGQTVRTDRGGVQGTV